MLLADLGADVVKVEPPGGDMMRNWPPLATDEAGETFSHNFASLNRNKRSVAANFKDPDDRRRVKTAAELAGMRRAQRAAEAAMDTCRDMLRRSSSSESFLAWAAGLWQVEARDNPSFDAYRRLDLFYVENWSCATGWGR